MGLVPSAGQSSTPPNKNYSGTTWRGQWWTGLLLPQIQIWPDILKEVPFMEAHLATHMTSYLTPPVAWHHRYNPQRSSVHVLTGKCHIWSTFGPPWSIIFQHIHGSDMDLGNFEASLTTLVTAFEQFLRFGSMHCPARGTNVIGVCQCKVECSLSPEKWLNFPIKRIEKYLMFCI